MVIIYLQYVNVMNVIGVWGHNPAMAPPPALPIMESTTLKSQNWSLQGFYNLFGLFKIKKIKKILKLHEIGF